MPKFALYISRPFLHVDHCVNSVNKNFTLNLTQGVFIDRNYRINHTETWNFNAPTLVTSVSHNITTKCGILCPKTPLLTEKQLHAIHFFVATRNVCPLAIPESCTQNMGLRLLENHSLRKYKYKWRYDRRSGDNFSFTVAYNGRTSRQSSFYRFLTLKTSPKNISITLLEISLKL